MKLMHVFLVFAVALIATGHTALAAGDAAKGKQLYIANCSACHNLDPSKPGAIGPEIKGSSLALLTTRVLAGTYPKGYKPKRNTKLMVPLPHLKPNLADIAAFLK
jgi:mono/diheme cytochrome c family protein